MSFRVTKRTDKRPSFLRSSSSASRRPQTKAPQIKRAATQIHDDDNADDEKLEDLGLVLTLSASIHVKDVSQAISHVKHNMFDEIPVERSGMNGARIAEVLNFRKNLPPIVTNAHVHALVDSPTQVEKDIGQLVSVKVLKRIVIPGRGVGSSAISDALVTVADWKERIEASALSDDLKGQQQSICVLMQLSLAEKYAQALVSGNESMDTFTADQSSALVQAGFLTAMSTIGTMTNGPKIDIKDLSRTAISVHNIARAASGSMDAVGGQGAIYRIGGGGVSGLNENSRSGGRSDDLKMSIPNVGAYLKLLQNAREHLITLLSRSKYNEAPVYLIQERWDGGISTKNPYGRSKDPFKMMLPGKTKKWKDFYGLKFDWVLAECLGSGLIELFNTRSVGLGMRLT